MRKVGNNNINITINGNNTKIQKNDFSNNKEIKKEGNKNENNK